MGEHNEVVKLFWTGGWDSTFRLLQLLVKYKKEVQPFYLLDPDRRSTGAEIYAMRNIKRRLFDRFPDTRNLLHNTIYHNIFDICPNPIITHSLENIDKKYGHIGTQYDWLARYCCENGLHGLEIGVTKGGTSFKILSPKIVFSSEGSNRVYWMDPRYEGTDEYNVFGYFRFPLYDFTKKEMQETTWKEGMDDLMKLTWFCHKPRPNYTPCGVCTPCTIAIQRGMGWRIPWTGRLRHYLHPEVFVRQNPKFENNLRMIKRWFGWVIHK